VKNMPERIQVAVVTHRGGAHLDAYFGSLANIAEAESVVLADLDGTAEPMARKLLKDKLKGVYKSSKELFAKETPGAALISMEAALAPPRIHEALDAGCHIILEKPACVRPQDFEAIAKKAEMRHLHVMLTLANRLHPAVLKARSLIQAGKLGKIYGVDMHIVADQTRLKSPAYHKTWFAKKSRAGGGHLIWLGIHWLDLAMHVSGAKIQKVAGFEANVGGQPLDVEDSAVAALQFDNGSLGTLTSGFYLDKGYHSHVQIWGSEGWLDIRPQLAIPLVWSSRKDESKGAEQQFQDPKAPLGYPPFVKEAVRAAAGLSPPPLTTHESLHVVKTVFAIYEAAATGRTQKV